MNARLYDPILGRFLAPDPVVTDPSCLLDFNRYMYARNNPMLYTDLNGESFKDWWKKNIADPWKREWNAVFGNGFTVSVGTNMQFQGGSLTVFPNAPNGMPYRGGFGIETNNFKTGYPVFANYQNGFVSTQAVNYETNLQHAVIGAETKARLLYIDNTIDALRHYLFGDGSPVYIGNNTLNALKNSPEFKANLQSFIIGKNEKHEGYFSIDMTKTVFHIGRTTVNYRLENINGQSKLTYNVFVNDGFWDPCSS